MDFPAVHADSSLSISPQNSTAWNNEITAADWWFAGLDQRIFAAGDARWTMRVVGVHFDRLHTWIQIEFAEDRGSSLLLRLTPWAGLQDALNIVRAEILWRTCSDPSGTDSLHSLGNCQNVVIRGVLLPAGPMG